MRLSCFLLVCVALTSATVSPGLINNDWATLERDVTLRYFSSENFHPSSDQDKIWDEMGENVTCTVNTQGKASVVPPSSYDASRPIKLFMHGFSVTGRDYTTNLLPAWMERYKGGSSVILLDWQPLASAFQWKSFTDYSYNEAAYNGIDVGEYAGLCLAELSNSHGLRADFLHLVGHSLGGQSVGKMGRSFQSAHLRSEKVKRITGLDPAGPRFETNGYQAALNNLKINILTADSASFVDVIHTNGGFTPSVIHAALHFEEPRLGYLQQLGHMDFYPDGGSHQTGCPATWRSLIGGESCSHSRAIMFYYYSINDRTLFPSKPCKSVTDCNKKIVETGDLAYMGEDAESYKGGRQLFYTDVQDCNWTYKDHNNVGCDTVEELTDAEKDLIQEFWGEGGNQEAVGQRQLEMIPVVWVDEGNQEVDGRGHMEQPIVKETLTTTQHPFVKQVSSKFQKLLQQSLHQISNSKCDSMNLAYNAVIRARMGLDCGGSSDHFSNNLGSFDDRRAVVEALRSCLGSKDEHLCLMRSCSHLGDTKCSSLREVENDLKNSLAIVCHLDPQSEVGLAGSSCGFWQKITCSQKVLAAEAACSNVTGIANIKACIEAILGIGSDCIPCVCEIIGC